MDSEDLEGSFLSDGYWIGSVTVRTTCVALATCFSSSYHELLFLKTLCDASFADDLPGEISVLYNNYGTIADYSMERKVPKYR